jgi:histidine triad (HIT) family protein
MSPTSDCIFCKMVRGEIPAERVHEDESVICIRDIRPQAPVHLLVIPKAHVVSLEAAVPAGGPAQSEMLGQLMVTVTQIARKRGLLPSGFRTVINTGAGGGQTVFHLHVHILGGETLGEALA